MALDKDIKKALQTAIGKKIAFVRNSKGLTQAQLSTESGVDTSYISKIESGISNPSIIVLIQISWALKMTLSELFSDKGKSKGNKDENIQKMVNRPKN